MKKSVLLAVSAMSLGLVGAAAFTPVTHAEVSSTQDATISAKVNGTLGVGSKEDATFDANGLDVSVDTLNANDMKASKAKNVVVSNNTGTGASLYIKAKNSTNLTSNSNTIPASDKVQAGISAWGYMADKDTSYKAVTTVNAKIGTAPSGLITKVPVVFGVSTSSTQAAGDYTGTVTYTVTQDTVTQG